MKARDTAHTFEVRQTKTGKGLFTVAPIKKGSFVIEYIGKKLPNKIADYMTTRYLFDLENGYTLDGSPMWNTARWINHSCDPNVEAELDEGHIYLYAARTIGEGEQITIDYGEEYVGEFITPHGCKCGVCLQK